MTALMGLLRPLQVFNDVVLRFGRGVGVVAIALMVVFILYQVVMRYAFNNAQPWPEEAARFMMLWMTGLLAPLAYRRGGFVAIDMVEAALPRFAAGILGLALLLLSLLVLLVGLQLGYKHIGSGCLFKSSTLWLPFTLKFTMPIPLTDLDLTLCTRGTHVYSFTWGWTKMPLTLSFLGVYVGVVMLTLVNIELILRSVIGMLGGQDRLRPMIVADLPEAD
ncbi:MAG: TRAP transporter small permease subunit [Rhodobacteraceae bacterium]|nr:TRAP transporter small permease subunit [Paracoccaceae bacterium]